MSSADVAVFGRICIAMVALLIGAIFVRWGAMLYKDGIRARTTSAEVVWKDVKFILVGGAPGALLSVAGLGVVLTTLLTFPSFASDGTTTTIGTPLPAVQSGVREPAVLRITPYKETVESLALITLRASDEAVASIQRGFAVLLTEAHSGPLTRRARYEMDQTRARLSHDASVLRQRLDELNAAATTLARMIEERAHANETPVMRRQMVERAREHRQTLDRQIRNADAAVTRIQASTRFYEELASLAHSNPMQAASELPPEAVERMRADILNQHQVIQDAVDAILAVAA